VLQRERLFALLDGASGKAIWIGGPPGSGKTTLVSSWLEARRMRHLWYRVRPGDADLASLFYELGARAGRRRAPLPRFTPDYRGGEVAFARRFFRELVEGRTPPWALVLDDLERLESPQPLVAVLRDVIEELSPGTKAVLVSRGQPPAEFARLIANGVMSVLGWEVLRLTEAEALAIARVHAPETAPQELERLVRWAAGWVTGLVLLASGPLGEADRQLNPKVLFPYLAGELLDRVDPETRRILVEGAIPPVLPVRIVNALCGSDRALGVLQDLARRAYFVALRGREDPVFELHPLAQEFLLERARTERRPEELKTLRARAAALLAEAGKVEDAIDLYRLAGAWPQVAQLVLLRGPHLLATGRSARLEGWLGALPPALAEEDPWIWYWRGMCRLALDPATARAHLARAWEGFDQSSDPRGLHLTFAAVIESFIFELADLRGMDDWIDRFEAMTVRYPAAAGAEFVQRSAAAMFAALTFRRLGSETFVEWERRALAVVQDASLAPPARLAMGSYLVLACAFRGEGRRAAQVVDTLAPLARAPGVDRPAALSWLTAEAVHFWHAGAPSRSDATASLGLRMARESGACSWDFLLRQQRVHATIAAGDLIRARDYIAGIEASLPAGRGAHAARLHEMEFLLAIHEGDAARALKAAHRFADAMRPTGIIFGETFGSLYVALALVEAGDPQARTSLEALHRRGPAGSALVEMIVEMAQADLERRSGNLAAAQEHLGRGLRVSGEKGLAPDIWFSRSRLAELCALALDSDIETEHVLALVRRLGLGAPAGHISERWPWSVRVRAFGSLEVLVGEKPLRPTARSRRGPLDVLPALLARGGSSASSQGVAAALWPESEGDLAHHALETAAYRLRRLLGHDVVQHRSGEIMLDTNRCWVDVLAFESLLAGAAACLQRLDAGGALAAGDGAIALYRGPFLKNREEPWVLSARERYRVRLGRFLSDLDRLGADREPLLRLRARFEAADPAVAVPSRSGRVDRT
jgi:hypothetical protein